MKCRYAMFYNRRQKGFSLPVAIFILIIMALVGAAAVSILDSSQQGLSSEVLSTRAFFSAESGAQYALAQLFTLDGSAASCQSPYPTVNLTSTGFAGCSAVVNCTSATIGSDIFYTITSTGTCDMAGALSVRQIELMAKGP